MNVILFGNRVFAEEVKKRSLGWVPTVYDWCPYKNRKFGEFPGRLAVKDPALSLLCHRFDS